MNELLLLDLTQSRQVKNPNRGQIFDHGLILEKFVLMRFN